ncbi:FBA1 [Symbiodinium sp. CCMP2592]|nr:FBA1 [Symbiodinium sp. CCMP2592]
MTGDQRVCLRQVAPPGSEKGIYALLPLGHDVWVCGHHPSIQVYSQRDMAQTSTEDGHKPYVSNLIGVDRVESKIIWSTSFGDRKLKVWRHTVRGEEASVDELKAANILYQQEEETQAERIESYLKKMRALEESSSGQQGEIDLLQKQLEDQTAKREELEVELGTLQKIFEEAGLAELLKDPEALSAFLTRAAALAAELRKLGIESLLEDPEEMARLLSLMNQLQEIFERCGLSSLLEKPSELEAMLLRYKAMQASFEKNGFSELFEDTDRLDKFLETHRQVRLSFQAAGFENLLDDAAAAEQFFQKRQADLESSAAASESVAALEAQLQQVTQDLEAMQGQRDALQRECDEIKDRLEAHRVGQLVSFNSDRHGLAL